MPQGIRKAKQIRYKVTQNLDLGDVKFTDKVVEDIFSKDLEPVVLAEMDLEVSKSDGELHGLNGAVVMPDNSNSAPGRSSKNIGPISPWTLVRKYGVQNWGRY